MYENFEKHVTIFTFDKLIVQLNNQNMFKHFIRLEWKSFFRSASMGTNLAMKTLMGFLVLYFIVIFCVAGVATFFDIKEELHLEPL